MTDSSQQLMGQVKILVTYFIGYLAGKNLIADELATQLIALATILIPMVYEHFEAQWKARVAAKNLEKTVTVATNAGAKSVDPEAMTYTSTEAKVLVENATNGGTK